ncbi:hypothetical protein HDU67_002107 [Dinochytrium kinnereticum]|nr:hypothetical protein HDU67_002107 [Dinochytrium kinnereticum]
MEVDEPRRCAAASSDAAAGDKSDAEDASVEPVTASQPAGKPQLTLPDLPSSILLLILETSSNVTALSQTCHRFHSLWSIASIRTNWLLRVTSGNVEALDIALSLFKDLRVAANLIDRASFSPAWLSHVLIDAVKGEQVTRTERKKSTGVEEEVLKLLVTRKSDGCFGEEEATEWVRHPFHADSKVICRFSEEISKDPAPLPAVQNDGDPLALLIRSMIKAGADLDLDVSLYLRSVLLMGGGPTSSMSTPNMRHAKPGQSRSASTISGMPISGPTLLSWILNESLRSVVSGASPTLQRPSATIPCGLASLILSAGSGHASACAALLESRRIKVNGLDDLAICVAAHGGWVDVVKVLIDHGADPGARDGMPVRVAKLVDREDVVEILEKSLSVLALGGSVKV